MSRALESLIGSERRAECARNDAALAAGRHIVPLHTGKVAIGIAYQPRPARVEGDATAIQAALLEKRTATPITRVQRLLGAVWRWL